jgi:hypothetical protein
VFIVGRNDVPIGAAITATDTGHTIRIAMDMERTEQPLMDGTTEQPLMDTARIDRAMGHIGRGLGTDMRTSRGLGPDHPRIRTSRRGGHAETACRSVGSDGPS